MTCSQFWKKQEKVFTPTDNLAIIQHNQLIKHRKMTLQQMEYIIAVDKFRHFGNAAEHCGITQPTLSAMIQKLEDELGLKIFDRSKQPVMPTSSGTLVIQQAQQVLMQVGRIKDIVNEEKQSLKGEFKLGILPTIAPYLLPRFLTKMMKKYPLLDIRVTEMKTHEIKTALTRGEIDAGIVANLSDMDNFKKTTLFFEPFHVYLSRESILFSRDVIRTSDLADEQLWLLDEGHCFRDQLVKFCHLKNARSSQEMYKLGSIETFMRMVEYAGGTTFIPELAVLQLSEQQKELVRPFAIPCPTRQIIILTNENYIRNALLETLAQEIRASVPNALLSQKSTQILI